IAIACLVERAPCLPSRTWWISSRTNSPAWVLADLPSRLSRRARSMVFFSGMAMSPDWSSSALGRLFALRHVLGAHAPHDVAHVVRHQQAAAPVERDADRP